MRIQPLADMIMASKDESLSEVHIGNVSGGIHGSIIAGRDVKNAVITLGGQATPADKEPTVDELKQLLAEIQAELAQIPAQQDALKEGSSAAPFTAHSAEQSVKDAAEKVEPEMDKEGAESVQKSLAEATTLLSGILNGARTVAEKSVEVGRAVKPIAEKCWRKVNAPHLVALVKAGVKFPDGQAEMFQLDMPDDDLLFSLTPSVFAATEVSIHNI
jgi:hypothetical protein